MRSARGAARRVCPSAEKGITLFFGDVPQGLHRNIFSRKNVAGSFFVYFAGGVAINGNLWQSIPGFTCNIGSGHRTKSEQH